MRENDLTIVAPGTFIRGKLFSDNILVIEGGVEGDIRGNRIIVKPNGWVHGDVLCRSLSIEPGGIVDGSVKVQTGGEMLLPAEKARNTLESGEDEASKRIPIIEELEPETDQDDASRQEDSPV